MFDKRTLPYWASLLVMIASGATLYAMGRAPMWQGGTIRLWYGPLGTAEANMHLTDWYTPSHIIHGLLFYGFLWLVARRLPVAWRLFIATVVEASWEVTENTNRVIEHYRNTTVSTDYIGDSVVNSSADILAMMLGFYLARKLPVWASVAMVLGFEALTTALIRDGLALNVLMLLWPNPAIVTWQSGG